MCNCCNIGVEIGAITVPDDLHRAEIEIDQRVGVLLCGKVLKDLRDFMWRYSAVLDKAPELIGSCTGLLQ